VIGFALWAGLVLVIMRLQVGVWFKTGYSLVETIYPWNRLDFSVPKPDEFRTGFPLATGSYCWWPCSPAIGLAGLAALRGRGRRVAFILVASMIPFVGFYTMFELGRHGDFGYGPRYQFPVVVPMAVGTGAILAQLWGQARRLSGAMGSFRRLAPLALALTAAISGVLGIAPLVYPANSIDVHEHNRLQDALAKTDLHHVVVLARQEIANIDSMDLTENLPLQYYPDQDVLVARTITPQSDVCVREHFRDRPIWRAVLVGTQVLFSLDIPPR